MNVCTTSKQSVHASHTNFGLETCILQHDSLLDKAFSEPQNSQWRDKRSKKQNTSSQKPYVIGQFIKPVGVCARNKS